MLSVARRRSLEPFMPTCNFPLMLTRLGEGETVA